VARVHPSRDLSAAPGELQQQEEPMRSLPITARWLAVSCALGIVALGDGVIRAETGSQIQTVANNQTTAGEMVAVPPTLLSLGFDWTIAGDDNRTARVEVAYRSKGQRDWRTGLPLLRLQNEIVGEGAGGTDAEYGNPQPFDGLKYRTPNMFSGSVLNLEPDTEYEVRLTLADPDGVKGEAVRTVTLRTRAEPKEAAGGKVYHVYPIGHAGPKQTPAFTGLMAAYYTGCSTSDFQNAYPPRVQPGDVILVHAGLYQGDRYHYAGADGQGVNNEGLCTLFDGTYYLTQSGTMEKPIVIKGAGDGEAIFDGDGTQTLFNVMGANYNYFDGITVRNANLAFMAGIKDIGGASGFVLKNSHVYDIGRGVQNDWSGSKNYYIADNVLTGRLVAREILRGPSGGGGTGGVWDEISGGPEILGGNGGSEYAIKVYGQGHVVAYNKIYGWHDGVDVATYGSPDGYCRLCVTPKETADRFPTAIDFYNNDIDNQGDNCVEADGGGRNIRIFKNRCFNIARGALSTQPVLGGPIYFYQNIVYTHGNVLKYVRTSSGILTYQNTFIGDRTTTSPISNSHFRNNLILGTDLPVTVYGTTTFTNYSSSDYNGIRVNRHERGRVAWNSPPFEMVVDYERMPTPRSFKTLAEYSQATRQDTHSVAVDYDVFQNVRMPDTKDVSRLYKQDDFDFRLKPGSAAVDAGTTLPTITDGFTGRAPDLGVVELDQPLPHYGPRTPRRPAQKPSAQED
jgi:hypothetical protein